MNREVLVLNNDWTPLNVCNLRRAIVLLYLGKADVLHVDDEAGTMGNDGRFPTPTVVKLRGHVKRPMPELKLSRRTIFARDNYTCQYCGTASKDLTIDHVIPKRAGGGAAWENLVCCCRKCNMKKSDKLAHQIGMRLTRPPRRPHYVPYISLTKYIVGRKNEIWRDYLPTYADLPD